MLCAHFWGVAHCKPRGLSRTNERTAEGAVDFFEARLLHNHKRLPVPKGWFWKDLVESFPCLCRSGFDVTLLVVEISSDHCPAGAGWTTAELPLDAWPLHVLTLEWSRCSGWAATSTVLCITFSRLCVAACVCRRRGAEREPAEDEEGGHVAGRARRQEYAGGPHDPRGHAEEDHAREVSE